MTFKDLSALDDLLPAELQYQQEKLRALGIDEVKTGFELEVPVRNNPLDTRMNDFWQERRAQLAEAAQTEGEKNRISNLPDAMSVLYEDVMSSMPAGSMQVPTVGRIEDNPNVLEFRSVATSPEVTAKLHAQLSELVKYKTEEYGLDDILALNPMSTHINFSFYKDGKNLVNPLNEEFGKEGAQIVRGMARAAFDSIPSHVSWNATDHPSIQTEQWPLVDTGPARRRTLRIAGYGDETSRVEFQLPVERGQNIGVAMSDILAGVVVAVDPQHAQYMEKHTLPAKPVTRPFMRYKKDDDYTLGYVNHLVNGSTINDKGFLVPHKTYIATEAKYFGAALDIPPIKDQRLLVDKIAGIISQVRIDKGNDGQPPKLVWPERMLPEKVIKRLEEGTELAHIVPAVEIVPGYDASAHKGLASSVASERFHRMRESYVLDNGHSDGYREMQKENTPEISLSATALKAYEQRENAISSPEKGQGRRTGWW